jgi:hypothetical protein
MVDRLLRHGKPCPVVSFACAVVCGLSLCRVDADTHGQHLATCESNDCDWCQLDRTGQCIHANRLATVSDSGRYLRTAYDLAAVVANGGGMRAEITSLKTDAARPRLREQLFQGLSQMEPDARASLNLSPATAGSRRAA